MIAQAIPSVPSPGPAVPAVELRGVVKTYADGRTRALDAVDLAVARGSFVALVGGSGSGKTTLLKTINRLIEPDAGEVRVDGRPVSHETPFKLRRRIGYAFQEVGLFPHMSVGENIALTPRLLGANSVEAAARVDELLDLTALPREFTRRRPDQLSGGQRQRVGLARALAARPGLMLMDEPFGALDPPTRETLGDGYRDLHDRLGLTTVMVTHDVQEAVLLADRIVVLMDGAVVADGAPAELLRSCADPRAAGLLAAPKRAADRVAAILAGDSPRG